jgi:hypothetical protein
MMNTKDFKGETTGTLDSKKMQHMLEAFDGFVGYLKA